MIARAPSPRISTLMQAAYEQRERRALAHEQSAREMRAVAEEELLDRVPMSFRPGDAWFVRAVKAAAILLDLRSERAADVGRVTVRPLGNRILLISAYDSSGAEARQCERAQFIKAWGLAEIIEAGGKP